MKGSKNILVTGSNGYIGGHVCKYLQDRGVYTIGLGRRKTPLHEVDQYICCDLQAECCKDILKSSISENLDAVVHLAADMRKEPFTRQVLTTNCVGTQQLIEFCEQDNIPAFIQLSSIPVIGAPIQNPVTEEHPINPPTIYHITKRTQELLADYAYRMFGLRTVSFRISSPVGIGMNPQTILPVFLDNAIIGKDLVLSGHGTRKQNYVHVTDIAQAIYKSIFSNAQGIFNLGSDHLVSNYELAEKCIEITASSSRITFSGQADPMDGYVWNISLDKIRSVIGYEPKVTIEDAIQELYEHKR